MAQAEADQSLEEVELPRWLGAALLEKGVRIEGVWEQHEEVKQVFLGLERGCPGDVEG